MELRYANDIDLRLLCDFFERHGEEYTYDVGERMEQEGEMPRWMAYVKQGGFKYVVHNICDRQNHVAWVSFENEFVGDYPNLLCGKNPSSFTIEAMKTSVVLRVSVECLRQFFDQSNETRELRTRMSEYVAMQFQSRYQDFHRAMPRKRYEMLLERCPGILNDLPLQDIASILNITPQTLSRIRKAIVYGMKK